MLEDIYTSEENIKKANKNAVLLARTRYLEQVSPFVQTSKDRLEYAQPEIERIISECAEYTHADRDYVAEHLTRIISEDFEKAAAPEAVTNPKDETLSFGDKDKEPKAKGFGGGPPTPPVKFDPAQVNPSPDESSDMSYRQGPLLEEELREPDVVHDLNEETFSGENKNNFSSVKTACFRCGIETDGPTCSSCQDAIVSLSYGEGIQPISPGTQPGSGSEQQVCPKCYKVIQAGETLQSHYNMTHPGEQPPVFSTWVKEGPASEAKTSCAHCNCGSEECDCSEDNPCGHSGCKFSNVKEAQMPGENEPGGMADMSQAPQPQAPQTMPQPHDADPIKVDQGLSSSPRERFDDIISELANKAAAKQFSQATNEEIQAIAQHLGIDEGEVRSNLKVVAKFGEAVAVNGEVGGNDSTEGMAEVDMEGMGGQVGNHEAEVPLDLAISKVAEDLQLEKDMVYTELKDSFGNQDLPGEYRTPIAGDHRYYLPQEMAGQQQMQQQPPTEGFPEQPPDDTRQNIQQQPAH